MAKNEEHYDAIVSFDEPIMIQDDNGELHTIYGILYNQKRRHHDDLFLWEVNRYITYLMGCSRAVKNGGSIAPELWIAKSGEMIILDNAAKDYIYTIMKDEMIGYRLLEFDKPLDILPDEVEDEWVIAPSILDQFSPKTDIQYKGKRK